MANSYYPAGPQPAPGTPLGFTNGTALDAIGAFASESPESSLAALQPSILYTEGRPGGDLTETLGSVMPQYLYLPASIEAVGTVQCDGSPPINVPGATAGQVLVADANGNFTPGTGGGGGSGMVNPMTTTGDLIKGGTGGAPARIPGGASAQVLTMVAGQPTWANASSGFANPMTTPGDVITGTTGGAAQRLGIGSSGQVLTVSGGAVSWQNSAAGFTNPMTTPGDVITGTTGGAAQRLAVGAAGQVLTVASGGTAVSWANSASGFSNPMTTTGDIIAGGTSGAAQRLGVGSTGQVLTVSGGAPAWANASSGFSNPMTSAGDMIAGTTAGVAQRLAIGSSGQVLTVSGGVPAWANAVTGFANPMTATGDMIAGGGSGTATRLAAGTNGQVLSMVSGNPAWANSPSGFANPMTTAGDLISGTTSGTAQRLGVGSTGQVLTVVGGAPAWAASASGFSNPMTTKGDLILGGTSGAAQRLGAGTSNYVLTSNGAGALPSWQSVSANAITTLAPSGDSSGVTDANNIMTAISNNGYVWLAAGNFYVKVNIVSLNTQALKKALIMGSGTGTVINAVGSGNGTNGPGGDNATIIYMHGAGGGSSGANSATNPGGCIRDLVIDGTGAGANVTLLDIGDAWGHRVDHVFTQNNAGTNCIGTRIGNDSYFTEKMTVTSLVSRGNATQVYMDSTVGSDVSHGYCDFEFYLYNQAGFNGITLASGVNVYGGSLFVRGNHDQSSTPLTGNWIIGLTGGSDLKEELLDIRMEGNQGTAYSANKLYFSGSGDSVTNCWGMWNVTGPPGATNGTSGQFTFAGICSDTNMQSIRTSPANGWFT